MQVCSICQRCYDDDTRECLEGCTPALSPIETGFIEGYSLETRLSSDPYGDLYRASELSSGTSCLIRVVSASESESEIFLNEAKSAGALFHPGIVDTYQVGAIPGGGVFVVTEDPDGRTLRDFIDELGVPQLLTTIEIVRQAAEAVHALNAAGIVHRAINPSNIILTKDNTDQLLVRLQNPDFGSVGQRKIISNKFAIDDALGALRYFAPEQCSSAEADVRSDVYSLGVVYYELLAGVPPFDAANATGLIQKHRNQSPPEVRINNFDLRMLVTHSLSETLQKPSRLRQSSANALARQLRHIEQLATHSSTPPPAGTVRTQPAGQIYTPPFAVEPLGQQQQAEVAFELSRDIPDEPVLTGNNEREAEAPETFTPRRAETRAPRRSRLKASKRKLNSIAAQANAEREAALRQEADKKALLLAEREAAAVREAERKIQLATETEAARLEREKEAFATLQVEREAKLIAEREALRLTSEKEAADKLAAEREAQLDVERAAAIRLAAELEAVRVAAANEAAARRLAEEEAASLLAAEREASAKLLAERDAARIAAEAEAAERELSARLAGEREAAAKLAAEKQAQIDLEREAAARLAAELEAVRIEAAARRAAEEEAKVLLAAEKEASAKLLAEKDAVRIAAETAAAEREEAALREAEKARMISHKAHPPLRLEIVDDPAPAVLEKERVDEVGSSKSSEPVTTVKPRAASVPTPPPIESSVAAATGPLEDMGLKAEIPERLRRPVRDIKVWKFDDEEITLVRPHRIRIDVEKSTTRTASRPVRSLVPNPESFAFQPTILVGKSNDQPVAELDRKDGMFGNFYGNVPGKISERRRTILLGCGFVAMMALILFGNDSVSRYFQGWSSADSVTSNPTEPSEPTDAAPIVTTATTKKAVKNSEKQATAAPPNVAKIKTTEDSKIKATAVVTSVRRASAETKVNPTPTETSKKTTPKKTGGTDKATPGTRPRVVATPR